MLIAYTLAHTDDAGRSLLTERLGDPELDADGVAALQRVIVDCGAREAVETMIAGYYDEAEWRASRRGREVSAARLGERLTTARIAAGGGGGPE